MFYLQGKQCIRKILSSFLTHPKLYLCQMGDLVSEAKVVYYTTLLQAKTKYLENQHISLSSVIVCKGIVLSDTFESIIWMHEK